MTHLITSSSSSSSMSSRCWALFRLSSSSSYPTIRLYTAAAAVIIGAKWSQKYRVVVRVERDVRGRRRRVDKGKLTSRRMEPEIVSLKWSMARPAGVTCIHRVMTMPASVRGAVPNRSYSSAAYISHSGGN